jgi:hypothetical protein
MEAEVEVKAEAKAKAKGQWEWGVFLAPLLQRIALMGNGVLEKVRKLHRNQD